MGFCSFSMNSLTLLLSYSLCNYRSIIHHRSVQPCLSLSRLLEQHGLYLREYWVFKEKLKTLLQFDGVTFKLLYTVRSLISSCWSL